MRLLASPLGYLLTWLYDFIGSYGIAVLVLTVIIKLALYPVYAKSIKSTMKMTEVQPKIQEIQQKYAKDRELMNEKMTELYKEEGVSMYGGCLPMVVQMIVIMGLFALLRNPMAYIDSDSMLFAIHEPFLWIQDLAQPDKWILPIMAAVATFIATLMSQNATVGANAQQTKMMNSIMKYFFPIMILWMARSYPAGLAIYWFGSQLIQIFYNMRFAKMRKESAEKRAKASKKKARA